MTIIQTAVLSAFAHTSCPLLHSQLIQAVSRYFAPTGDHNSVRPELVLQVLGSSMINFWWGLDMQVPQKHGAALFCKGHLHERCTRIWKRHGCFDTKEMRAYGYTTVLQLGVRVSYSLTVAKLPGRRVPRVVRL